MGSQDHRPWVPPEGFDEAHRSGDALRLYNSLLDQKMAFVPAAGPHSKRITMYSCGPTTYDSAHMGHSRNYVNLDVIRRVLEDYFGYNVLFVQNVTDVDDKIIFRARRLHLLHDYRGSKKSHEQVSRDCEAAMQTALSRARQKQADAQSSLDKAAQGQPALVEGPCGKHQPSSKAARELESLDTQVRQEKLLVEQLEKVDQQFQDSRQGDATAMIDAVADQLAQKLDDEYLAAAREAAEHAAASSSPSNHDSSARSQPTANGISGSQSSSNHERFVDQAIFRQHAARYEQEFTEDMRALGCRPPDVVTRVTDYMDTIIAYIQQICNNGMAYAHEGTVRFNSQAFRQNGHDYGKLSPWARSAATAGADGEAESSMSGKRHPMDFALWKAKKPGEPSWPSPWGPGRPGWHIECSAMANEILGGRIDIHAGGEDLRFPHHTNELAQAEAYLHRSDGTDGGQHACAASDACRQWVNYFIHSGHLSIEGLKMSKSLKNFTTIREGLKKYSARQLRLMYIMHAWEKPMAYGSQALDAARAKEKEFKNFFQNVGVALRENPANTTRGHWAEGEKRLYDDVSDAEDKVHHALLDSINTKDALGALTDLMAAVNRYMLSGDKTPRQASLIRRAAAYVTRMLRVFGVSHACPSELGFGGPETSAPGASREDMQGPVLAVLASFRDDVRSKARSSKDPETKACVLDMCDRVRNKDLVELGVRLEDRTDGPSAIKYDDPETLRAEVAAKAEQDAARAAEKQAKGGSKSVAQRRLELQKQEKEHANFCKLMKGGRNHQEALKEKYSRFDADGMPTHDADGNELADKAASKARKDAEKKKATYAPLVAHLQADCNYLETLGKHIQQEAEALKNES